MITLRVTIGVTICLVAACGPTAQVQRGTPPAAVTSPTPAVEWRPDERVLSCSALGTTLVLSPTTTVGPVSVTPSRVIVVDNNQHVRALSVSSDRVSDDLRQCILDDFAQVQKAVSGSVPDTIAVRQVRLTDGRLLVDYALGDGPDGEESFVFEYRLIERNDWSCRIAAVERVGHDSVAANHEQVVGRFGRIEDSAGVDLSRTSGPNPQSGADHLLLDGLFVVGLNVFRVVGRP